ncbi:MAG: hypothetical protein GXP10_07875 [Gammaproteobacteria bacterium]|nr:hypothetical protein [Gammaproteobacteria bacterium]
MSKSNQEKRCVLRPDKKGVWWDIALYVPTVIFLLSIAFQLWYTPSQNWSYLLVFAATFFFLVGANRIFKSRLLLLSSSPIAIGANKHRVRLELSGGSKVDLVKNVRYFPDFSGKSFGLTGMDLAGKKQQYIFLRGQFSDEAEYKELREFLRIFA